MRIAKIKTMLFVFLVSTFASINALAYPIWLRIDNPRAHSLYIISESEGITIEIPPAGFREFKIAGPSDWRIRYASGLYHTAKMFNLDIELDHYIETSCRNYIGDNWNKKTVKYCSLRLEESSTGIATSSYALTVTEIKDLDIAYDTDACRLNPNELAMKLVAISRGAPLVPSDLFSHAKCLYRIPK